METDAMCTVCLKESIKQHEYTKPCHVELQRLNDGQLQSLGNICRKQNPASGAAKLLVPNGPRRKIMAVDQSRSLVLNFRHRKSIFIKLPVSKENNMHNKNKLGKEYLQAICGKRYFDCTVKVRKCKQVDDLLLETRATSRKVSFNNVVEVILVPFPSRKRSF